MDLPRFAAAAALVSLLAACGTGGETRSSEQTAGADSSAIQPPVPLDPVPTISFPDGLEDTAAVLTVRLRLYTDDQGHVVPESTRVAETSGVTTADSAAVAGAARLRYAPAQRDGRPVAAAFVQPVEFRRP